METKKSIPPEKLGTTGIIIGIVLALAFIVIGSVFFGLKQGVAPSSDSQSEQIDPSLYAPSGN